MFLYNSFNTRETLDICKITKLRDYQILFDEFFLLLCCPIIKILSSLSPPPLLSPSPPSPLSLELKILDISYYVSPFVRAH